MHQKAFVTLNRELANNSLEARTYADSYLVENGFITRERFCSGPGDWFVIGGRWSGELETQSKGINFASRSRKMLKTGCITDKLAKKHKDKLQSLWEELGFNGKNPYLRNPYRQLGYEDDAKIVNTSLYRTLLKRYEGLYEDSEGKFWDLDADEVSVEFIGKKWIVVVDYHH